MVHESVDDGKGGGGKPLEKQHSDDDDDDDYISASLCLKEQITYLSGVMQE